ncbi:MAG: hypothetical protein ACR2LE_08980 [Nocardioidaceae bacterium]
MDDSPDTASSIVLSAAEMVGLTISPADLPAVTAHLALLRGFAAVVGAPEPEPGPVFRP